MAHSFQPIGKIAASEDSLDQYTASIPASCLSVNGHRGNTSTEQCVRADIRAPSGDSYLQKSCNSTRHNIENVLSPPPQAHLPGCSSERASREIEEREIAMSLGAASYGIRPESVVALKTPATHRQRYQRLWLHWFTAYRILIWLTSATNLAILIALVRRSIDGPGFSLVGPLIATAANIFAAVLIRQEEVISVSFAIVAKTPASLPLAVRRIIADFHHYGGVHIGCSVSALLWYFLFVIFNTTSFVDNAKKGLTTGWLWADILTCYAFLLAILMVCVTAHPRLRVRFHNTFERIHRFGGWVALLVLWVNAGVSSHPPEGGSTLMYKNAAVWLLAATTFLIILPWLRIRRIPITAAAVSAREVKLMFPYANMPYTCTARFSLNPLTEWHAFATIPTPDAQSAYILISQAGDWTKSLIQNPPTHIWMRQPPAQNFLAFAPLFSSLLFVGTGAGIGPLLSLLSSPTIKLMRAQGRQIRVMWCVHDPDNAHWGFVQDIIRAVDPMPKIFDSREGRPDLQFEVNYMREICGIEAVMIVSNAKVTRDMVETIKGKGGAAYGAVFDS